MGRYGAGLTCLRPFFVFRHPLTGSKKWKASLRRGVQFGHKIKTKIEGYEKVHVGNSFGTGLPGAGNIGVHNTGRNPAIMRAEQNSHSRS